MKIGNFPQAGIITTLDVGNARAKVVLPLFKIETGWVPVATHLLYQTQVSFENLELVSGTVDGDPVITFDSISAANGSAAKIMYGSLKVGDEVAVIFLSGDINQGRVIARF